jgi:hypothetical protein
MSATDFLKTATPKEKLVAALEVLREFKRCESDAEYLHRPFITWAVFEIFEEYLEYLVDNAPLKPDTVEYIKSLSEEGKPQ